MLRWGLIGCGDIAEKRVAAALKDSRDSALLAVASARPERARDFAARHGIPRHYADWRALVGDRELDAVYVATPVRLHEEQTVAAAHAGKHVLCEKPMALTAASCDRMIEAARAHGVTLGVAYYRHLYPAVIRMRELLTSGDLGHPVAARAETFEPFDVPPDHPRAWFLRRDEAGGGPMFDFGCHRIEVLHSLLGPIENARGFLSNVRFREREVEDTCVAHLLFKGGVQATLTVSHAAREPRDTFDLYGTAGSVHVPVLNKGVMLVATAGGEREETHPPHANLHLPLVQDFVHAVRDRRQPAVPGETGRDVARALDAIYADAR
jgi:predicted dehydrogenase